MDWQQAIERQRGALVRIVAALFAMTGLVEGNTISRLPRPLYRAVLRILYPAESAVRRLIIVVARGLQVRLPASRPVPPGLKALQRKVSQRMSFKLLDGRRCFNPQSQRPARGSVPRIHAFSDGQWVTILGRSPFDPEPQKDNTIDAARLARRLSAIKSALENAARGKASGTLAGKGRGQAARKIPQAAPPRSPSRPSRAAGTRSGRDLEGLPLARLGSSQAGYILNKLARDPLKSKRTPINFVMPAQAGIPLLIEIEEERWTQPSLG
jgi:hypothetical protein